MISVLILTLIFWISSCGAVQTSVRVRQSAENTNTTITVKNGEGATTSVTVEPKISLADSVLTIINK